MAKKMTVIQGFTLIEMMIVIAIIAILVGIGMPSYKSYTRKAHYSEVVAAASPFKAGVEECFNTNGSLDGCDNGQNGVPPAIMASNDAQGGMVDSVNVEKGVITVVPKDKYGITPNDTYVLTPDIYNDALTWNSSGGGVELGYAK